ncbi:hypothetical protein GDO81_015735 [Engystomops pustulosus]|uniref:Uncharacterized protein n=1 Tax=Engystomops pustulosus TaxID=76066 RepID=A0AAV7AWQ2_ENGPU|nr:hypothetical protein GDO81_015735 [Engystomops pustulosus]
MRAPQYKIILKNPTKFYRLLDTNDGFTQKCKSCIDCGLEKVTFICAAWSIGDVRCSGLLIIHTTCVMQTPSLMSRASCKTSPSSPA